MKHHTKLTLSERKLISKWLGEGKSVRECGRLLNKSHSTVSREIRRNLYKGIIYEPLHAENTSIKRKTRAWEAKHPLKNKDVFEYTIKHLRKGWSPEGISGRLRKVDHPGDPHWHICSETIYAFIYSRHPKAKELKLWEYLRRKQKKRKKKSGRKVARVRIPDRISIHERPKEIEKRKIPGHWEGDSIVGKGHTNGLHTEYERVTSIIKIQKIKRINSTETIKAQLKIFKSLPKALRKSTTLDNGSEMVKHTILRSKLNMDTYHADPYSSWQRGGNENANLWIRYYFPKGTNFSKIPDSDIQDVEWELNNRPRKRLGFKTPQEVFNSCVVRL